MQPDLFSDEFKLACSDYLFLLDREYPGRSTLDLVCNHYQLNNFQRAILYRGVFSARESSLRRQKLPGQYKSQPLTVDLLNVLFTVANYLYGRDLFLATDGLLKDDGACFIKPQPGKILLKAVKLLAASLEILKPGDSVLYLDEDYDHCKYVSAELGRVLSCSRIFCVKNPDRVLISTESGWIATSDSEVIDKSPCPVFDLARYILQQNFNLQLVDLGEFIGV